MEYDTQQICAKSRNRKTSIILQLLDENYNVVDELQGDILDGSFTIKNSIDSNFSRRSGSINLKLTKELSTQYYKIDLLHTIRLLIVITDNITSLTASYNMGIFLLSNPQVLQSITDEKITVNLLDLMANYDGTFGGSVDANQTAKISSGTNIGVAIQATATDMMKLSNDKIKIESTDSVTIEDISTSPESNITDHLKSIMDDALNYDLYFNEDGTLVFEYIKNGTTDAIFQEFINSEIVVSYEIDEEFSNVRNVVNIVGAMTDNDTIQQTGQYKETNLNNPLNIYAIGERPITLSFDKLQTSDECSNQAKYECQQRTNYKEKIVMEILPDFRLQPNKKIKIQYTSSTENLQIDGEYLIDEISCEFKSSGLMTITCHKIYATM